MMSEDCVVVYSDVFNGMKQELLLLRADLVTVQKDRDKLLEELEQAKYQLYEALAKADRWRSALVKAGPFFKWDLGKGSKEDFAAIMNGIVEAMGGSE